MMALWMSSSCLLPCRLPSGRQSRPLPSAILFNAAYRGLSADIVGMAPYPAGLIRRQRCGICKAGYWEGEPVCAVIVPVLPYRISEPLGGWINGTDGTPTNFYRSNSSRISNSLALACMQAEWVFKTGSNMPSTFKDRCRPAFCTCSGWTIAQPPLTVHGL
jgi:hypothetical protein